MILFVDGCVREASRTRELAKAVLNQENGEIQTVCLYKDGPDGLDADALRLRDDRLRQRDYAHPIFQWARQFAQADTIVLAAPYWDLLFPTKVRAYLESVTVSGITFFYNEAGIPQGLCRAKRLIYVTTAGGPIVQNLGFEYVQTLAKTFYGIPDVRLIKAEGLDIWGADPAAILGKAIEEMNTVLNGGSGF